MNIVRHKSASERSSSTAARHTLSPCPLPPPATALALTGTRGVSAPPRPRVGQPRAITEKSEQEEGRENNLLEKIGKAGVIAAMDADIREV